MYKYIYLRRLFKLTCEIKLFFFKYLLHFKKRLYVSMGKIKIQMKGNTEWNNGDGGTQWQASKKRLMFLQFRIFSPPSSRLSFFSTLSLLPFHPLFILPLVIEPSYLSFILSFVVFTLITVFFPFPFHCQRHAIYITIHVSLTLLSYRPLPFCLL